jgi:tetratricopeptide (TPR) repeat protein
MSEPTRPDRPALPTVVLDQIDRICDRFEAAWGAGERPRIEDFLDGVAAPYRPSLLRDLLDAELDARRRLGERPEPDEYRAHFPDDLSAIESAFDRSARPTGAPPGAEAAKAHDDASRALEPTRAADPETTETYDQATERGRTTDLGPRAAPGNPEVRTWHDSLGDGDRLPPGAAVRYFGDYEIRRELGRGGMGVVYQAKQVSLNRPVALKMVKAGVLAGDDELRRFRNEAEAVATLDHPGIVPVYEVGEHAGQHYFSMKLVLGGSLVPLMERYREDPKTAARLVAEAAEAVAHAHARGILHRDLKPANILVDQEGHPHITDFGLAKRVEGDIELTQSGAIVGTPAYMSPEQASGRRWAMTTASDVYGLGAVLYALLTGRPPFGGDSVVETIDAVRNRPAEPPRRLNAAVPRDLETICLRCLEKEPRRRYATAQALAADLEAWLESRPIAARRVGAAERAWLWCKRRPAVAALSAAVAVAIVGGTATVISVQAKANAELRTANRRVEQRYELAVEAIKTFHTGVSEDFLLKQDQFKDLRDRLLESAANFYGRLSALLGRETGPASHRGLAQANFQLAELTSRVGRKTEALAGHRAVLALREAIAATAGADAATKTDVGRSLVTIAGLREAIGETTQALQTYERAAEILADQLSSDASARATLADCRSRRAWLLLKTGATADALESYRAARSAQESLARVPGATIEARRDLATTLNGIGVVLSETGKGAEAMDALREALLIRRQLADENPRSIGLRFVRVASHCTLGEALQRIGRAAEAEAEYRTAIGLGEDLVRANAAVTDFIAQLALGHSGLGFALAETGWIEQACDEHRQAIALLQRLADENPEATDYRARLAVNRGTLGHLLSRIGRNQESMGENKKAISLMKRLADENPEVTDFRARLAGGHDNLGQMMLQIGRPEEAVPEFRESVALLQGLADSHPDVIMFRGRLGYTRINLGICLARTGQMDAAEAEYRAAIGLFRSLTADDSTVSEFRNGLALGHHDLGMLLAYRKKPSEAESAYREALALRRKLVDDHPEVLEYRGRLADSHAVLGDLLIGHEGRSPEAETEYRRALAIRQKLMERNPQIRQFRVDLAFSITRLARLERRRGQGSEALAGFRTAAGLMERLSAPTHEELYDQCCYLALAAGVATDPGSGVPAAEADRAMASLRRAVADGFRDIAHMRIDADLDPLRGRDDFRLLMMDLAMPAKPFARAQ